MFPVAARNAQIAPFYVMEIVKAAARRHAEGLSVIHMSIGEPDFSAPDAVKEAAGAAIARGATGYSPALGLDPLREAIASHYDRAYGLPVDPARVVVTAGASGALFLALAAVLDRDAEVLMPDPSYPCNRHFVTALEGRTKLIPAHPHARFQLTARVGGRSLVRANRGRDARLTVESHRHIDHANCSSGGCPVGGARARRLRDRR
jgi:aspartate/methionine/tyrosine aminotransferase